MTDKDIPISKLSSTFTLSKPVLIHDSTEVASTKLVSKTGTDKDTAIQANNGAIKIPKTNDEAECLLHDIGAGRVSLRGISGVNVSNLAAKIAVATNSDPKFILQLLISLIEGEKMGSKEPTVLQSHVPKKQQSSSGIPGQHLQAANTSTALTHHGSMQKKSRPGHEDRSIISKKEKIVDELQAPYSKSAMERSGKQDQNTLMLSDLDRTLTPIKPNESAVKGQCSSSTNTVSSSKTVMLYSNALQEQNSSHSMALSERVMSQPQYVYRELGPETIQKITGSEDLDQHKISAIAANIVSQSTRPVSSVIPLVALPESRPLYRDSGVQCFTRSQQAQHVERGASFERLGSKSKHNNVPTVDAAIQCDVTENGSDLFSDPDVNIASHQNLKKVSNATSNSSIKTVSSRHLSSTAIFGDESYDQPTKGITLSPVMSEVEPSLFEQLDANWKPHKTTTQNRQVTRTGSFNTHAQPEKPVMGRLSDPNLKLTEDRIHDILPRISDMKVRESNAIFYPLMATNQTMLGRPSVAQSTQMQSPYKPPQQQQKAVKGSSSNENIAHAIGPALSKTVSMPTIQIIVPNEVSFSGVQCIGVAVNECLPIHNPSSRWIQCMLEVVFYSVNGSQVR